ncbi:tRNA-splicing endonuclease subunit Sen54 isoform X2 [Hypomesus transpacificus]|uniref:tRNA-splicing endonuclease subunit Sen54 isoform X2 n=1 Tax=Hypomesus transpacificus TaxID=137520 RepID=UPI001F0875B8|nr:tRNA-splicing endonuclease subunit Sen54 isoform X2 [Hypomesus transpacificus]
MADQNRSDAKFDFCSEILSPSELFAARSRSHKIPVRGQKEFLPSDSRKQRERLQQSLDEHWSLVSEERVERLGNLVKAVWLPSESVVELQSPAGKFWQTMGFSARGKQCLHPEEALYLMECGNLQVFHRDLPLSIQEAYERFLSSRTVSLQQYQVFGHLKRLGYVVNRFDISSVASQYERQLNLPVSRERGGRHVKRKRSPSPPPRITEAQQGSTSEERKERDDGERSERRDQEEREDRREKERNDRMEERGEGEETERKKEEGTDSFSPDSPSRHTASRPSDLTMATLPGTPGLTEAGMGRSWWAGEDPDQAGTHLHPAPNLPLPQPQPSSSSAPPRWASISFPDLGSRRALPSSLPSPEPSLLPGALAVGPCPVAPWLQRLSLRQVHMSRGERERERERDRYRRDVNEDREVRCCRNWAEYRQLLAQRRGRSHRDRPAHLWEGKVTPLHDPRHPTSCGELLDKISVIKPYRLTDGPSREQGSEGWRLCFDVYQPDTVAEFRKSSPGRPYSRMCVCRSGRHTHTHTPRCRAFITASQGRHLTSGWWSS